MIVFPPPPPPPPPSLPPSPSGVGEELELLSNVYFDDLQISSKDKLDILCAYMW